MDEVFVSVIAAVSAVLAAAIGAGGAILAQRLSVRATDRASEKRFQWEQTQAIRRERAERDALFAETKRQLFANYLAMHSSFDDELSLIWFESNDPEDRSKVGETWQRYYRQVRPMQAEIALVAPSLAEVSEEVGKAGAKVIWGLIRQFDQGGSVKGVVMGERRNGYTASIKACRGAMAEHLQGEPTPGRVALDGE